MRLEGRTFKSGKWWLIEVPDLEVMTQGKSKKNAFFMIADAIELLIDKPGFKISVIPDKRNTFTIAANDSTALLAFFLQRQRMKSGLTLREVAMKMNSKSPNAYARYEQGKAVPSVTTLQALLKALNPKSGLILKVG